jgi:transcriptional regulator with XRE-family HTH domain
LSVPYLSDLERRSGVNPTLETLTTIAEALGCSAAELVGGDGAEPDQRLAPSLARYVRGDEFARRVDLIAERSHRPAEEVKPALIDFLARAPKRSSGELSPTDWQRLMDVYQVITGET